MDNIETPPSPIHFSSGELEPSRIDKNYVSVRPKFKSTISKRPFNAITQSVKNHTDLVKVNDSIQDSDLQSNHELKKANIGLKTLELWGKYLKELIVVPPPLEIGDRCIKITYKSSFGISLDDLFEAMLNYGTIETIVQLSPNCYSVNYLQPKSAEVAFDFLKRTDIEPLASTHNRNHENENILPYTVDICRRSHIPSKQSFILRNVLGVLQRNVIELITSLFSGAVVDKPKSIWHGYVLVHFDQNIADARTALSNLQRPLYMYFGIIMQYYGAPQLELNTSSNICLQESENTNEELTPLQTLICTRKAPHLDKNKSQPSQQYISRYAAIATDKLKHFE